MSCENNTWNWGSCNPGPAVNIKKLLFSLNDCQTNDNYSNCNDVWTVDCLTYDSPGDCGSSSPCGPNQQATLHCAGFANMVQWVTAEAGAFMDDTAYPWGNQHTVTFNTSASTEPDSHSNSGISGFDPLGSFWQSQIGNDGGDSPGPCSGCFYNGGLCSVLSGQMVAYQMTGSLYINFSATLINNGTGVQTNLAESATCLAGGGGCPPAGPCQSYDAGLLTYYVPMPPFAALCPDGMTFAGAPSPSGLAAGFYLGIFNQTSCCNNTASGECTFVPGPDIGACGSNPP